MAGVFMSSVPAKAVRMTQVQWRLVTVLLCLACLVVPIACGNAEDPPPPDDGVPTTTAAPEEPPAAPPAVAPDEPAEASPDLDPEVLALIGQVEGRSPMSRLRAINELAQLRRAPKPVIDALYAAMEHPDPTTVRMAGLALIRQAEVSPQAITALQRSLKDRGRMETVLGLLALGVEQAARMGSSILGEWSRALAPDIVRLLESDPNPQKRLNLLGILATIAPLSQEAALGLAEFLRTSEDEMERRQAVWQLARSEADCPEATAALKKARSDPDPDIAAGAAFGVWKRGGSARAAAEALDHVLWVGRAKEIALVALCEMGPEAKLALTMIIRTLETGSRSARPLAAKAIGMIGVASEEAVAALAAQLPIHREGNPVIMEPRRVETIQALGRLGPGASSAAPALAVCIDERGYTVFVEAALRKMGPDAIRRLREKITSEDWPRDLREKVAAFIRETEGDK